MKVCPECRTTYHEAAPVCPADGVSLLDISPDDARCGTVLDARYVILGKLGAGGMGTVYTAWQLSTGRTVALKLLAEAINDNPTAIQRFMREARMTAGLSSPHVVRVHDFGQLEDGTAYMAMEWIDGDPLEDLIDGPMPPARAIELVRQVCIALEEAHEQGLVHRDLKPGNIIVRQLADGGDFAQVLDFGIAKVLDETQTALTHESQNPGTPAYMSPEQARNEPVGAPTDLYALGVILFEMLVGERPFTGTSAMSVMLQHVQATPPSLKSRLPMLPDVEAIDAVLQQSLAKKVTDRYPSASALRADLERLKTGATPEALTNPTVKPTRGFGWNLQALGCSVQLAVAVGALAFFVLPAMRDDAPSKFDDIVQAEPPPSALQKAAESAPSKRAAPQPSTESKLDEPTPTPEPKLDDSTPDKPTPKPNPGSGFGRGGQGQMGPAIGDKRSATETVGRKGGSKSKPQTKELDDLEEEAFADKVIATPTEANTADAAKGKRKRAKTVVPDDDDGAGQKNKADTPVEPLKTPVQPSPPPAVTGRADAPAKPPKVARRAQAAPATPAELERELRASAPKIRATCGPGIWPLEVTIDMQGRVQRVRITQPGRAAHAKANCVLETIRALTFPAPARPVPLRLTL